MTEAIGSLSQLVHPQHQLVVLSAVRGHLGQLRFGIGDLTSDGGPNLSDDLAIWSEKHVGHLPYDVTEFNLNSNLAFFRALCR